MPRDSRGGYAKYIVRYGQYNKTKCSNNLDPYCTW